MRRHRLDLLFNLYLLHRLDRMTLLRTHINAFFWFRYQPILVWLEIPSLFLLFFFRYRTAPFLGGLTRSKIVLVASGNDDIVDLENHPAELSGKK